MWSLGRKKRWWAEIEKGIGNLDFEFWLLIENSNQRN
jgi:hypothetical protein